MDETKLTKQEMFDRAVRGLASQGWERCKDIALNCVYTNDKGQHCAWGWVDPSIPSGSIGDVRRLAAGGFGIAGTLSDRDIDFAMNLQAEHDAGTHPQAMKDGMRRFSIVHNLTWPSEVSK